MNNFLKKLIFLAHCWTIASSVYGMASRLLVAIDKDELQLLLDPNLDYFSSAPDLLEKDLDKASIQKSAGSTFLHAEGKDFSFQATLSLASTPKKAFKTRKYILSRSTGLSPPIA